MKKKHLGHSVYRHKEYSYYGTKLDWVESRINLGSLIVRDPIDEGERIDYTVIIRYGRNLVSYIRRIPFDLDSNVFMDETMDENMIMITGNRNESYSYSIYLTNNLTIDHN